MEDPVTGYRLAGFWRRTAGWLIDIAVKLPVVLALLGVTGMKAPEAVGLAVDAAYWIGFITALGATPGMRAVGERVIRASDGGKVGVADAVIRWVGFGVDGLTLGIGFLWCAWDRRKQAVHDHLARTLVVLDS